VAAVFNETTQQHAGTNGISWLAVSAMAGNEGGGAICGQRSINGGSVMAKAL